MTTMPSPVVYVVDDDPAVLRGMERLMRAGGFDYAVFASSEDFLNNVTREAVGCAVVDLVMPRVDGLQLQKALVAHGCSLPIIFITGRGDISSTVEAMKGGAIDFLTKPFKPQQLLSAIRVAIEANVSSWKERCELGELQARISTLTPRESEVLRHVIGGFLNKQTAAELGMTEKTVKFHRANLLPKLRASSVAELARLAARAGIEPVMRRR